LSIDDKVHSQSFQWLQKSLYQRAVPVILKLIRTV